LLTTNPWINPGIPGLVLSNPEIPGLENGPGMGNPAQHLQCWNHVGRTKLGVSHQVAILLPQVSFHKVHNGLVAVNMPLELRYNSVPTQTENSMAYHIPASSVDDEKNSLFYSTVRDWNCLPDDSVHMSLAEHFRDYTLL